ncbi:MAG: hypothetical protein WD043_12830 [Gemmatimonadales bacterium]
MMPEPPDMRPLLAPLRPRPVPDPDALWVRIREGAVVTPRHAWRSPRPWLIAAAVMLAAAGGGVVGMLSHYRAPTEWTIPGAATLTAGGVIEAGEAPVDVMVGRIGTVTLGPGSRVRREAGGLFGHRLTLEHGLISAVINAPPRLFFVQTSSVLATDLGCAYTLEVDSAGISRLYVTAGWVELRERGGMALVPAGLVAVTRPGHAPGTPYPANLDVGARTALERLDAGDGLSGDLDLVLASMGTAADHVTYRKARGITLWHLAQRLTGGQRVRVVHHLAALAPPPEDVTMEGILALDRHMLDQWRRDLNPMWSEEALPWPQRVGRKLWTWAMR